MLHYGLVVNILSNEAHTSKRKSLGRNLEIAQPQIIYSRQLYFWFLKKTNKIQKDVLVWRREAAEPIPLFMDLFLRQILKVMYWASKGVCGRSGWESHPLPTCFSACCKFFLLQKNQLQRSWIENLPFSICSYPHSSPAMPSPFTLTNDWLVLFLLLSSVYLLQ